MRIADYADHAEPGVRDPRRRSTFALVYTAPETFGGPGLGPQLDRAAHVQRAPAGWRFGLTGEGCSRTAARRVKGTGIMVEAMIGVARRARRPGVRLRSFLALLPLLIGGISVLATFLSSAA